MSAASYQRRVADLQKWIYDSGYYPELWEQALAVCDRMSKVDIEKQLYGPLELHVALNEFWCDLPDDPAIRRGPFFELCDLCVEDIE